MASDASDDGQYKTADESDDEGQISFRNELTSSSESDDEVSGKKSMPSIFKFGKLTTSSNNSGKEIEEFQVGKDQEEKSSEGIEGVKRQALELPSDESGETALQPLDTDKSVKFEGGFPGRDSFDSTEDLKEQEYDYMDIREDSNMEADEKVDTAETVEEKETLRDNMNISHMSPSYMEGLEGNAEKGFLQEANDTDMAYQMGDPISNTESFVILDHQPTSPVTVVVNNQMGETEVSFQEVTLIPSSEGFEESFEIFDESFGESGPIYENIGNIKGTPPNSKDTKMTPLPIPGNPIKEAYIDLSQSSSAEVQQEMVDIVKQEKDESAAERNSLRIEFSASSVIVYEENVISKVDESKQISEECIQFDDAEETADSEQIPQMDTKIDDTEHLSQYEKQIGDSVQQPQIESHVNNTEQSPQGDTYVDDAEEIPQKYTQMDKAQERLVKDTQIEIAEKSPQDSQDDTEQRPQKDNQDDNTEHDASSKKVSDLMKMFESNSVISDEDKTRKNADDGLHSIKSSPDENESKTHVSELPLKITPVPKRRGNIVLKPSKQPLAEPKSVKQFNSEESQKEQSDVPESPLQQCETQKDDHNESRFPNEMGLFQPPLPQKNQVITESVKPERLEDETHEDSRPPTPPPKGIAVMESLKHVRLEKEMLESTELTRPPTPPPKSLAVMKTYKPEAQSSVTSEPSAAQSTPPLPPPKRSLDQSTNISPQSMHSSLSGQLHDQQEPNLQSQQERPSLPTWHLHGHLSGAQGTTGYGKPQGSEGDVQMQSASDGHQNLTHGAYGQPNWSTGVSGQPTKLPGHPVQPPWVPQPWGQPHTSMGSNGPHAQYYPQWIPFYHGYSQRFPPNMQQGDFPRMNAQGPVHRPPYFASQEPPSGQTHKTTENQHFQQQQQHQQKQQQQQQQQQPRLHVPEGEASGKAKYAEPNRKQKEQQKPENKEIEKAKDESEKTNQKPSKTSKTTEVPKASTDGKKNEDATAKRDKEKKDVKSPKQPGQNIIGSSPQPTKRKEEQKHGKGTKSANTESEEMTSEPGYMMVIGLNENTSDDNLWNFIESKTDTNLKEIVYGPRRENAVVIFERKPDHENLQNKVSKKTLDSKVLEVYNMPTPTSIIVSTKEPKEFSTDTLTYHFESKKFGSAELVEDGIKITEDGCYIMTFTDSDAVKRVCTMEHTVEKTPLNVSPYYEYKKWAAWNNANHGINIPAPFEHQVDPILLKYLQAFPRAMKAMQIAMEEINARIDLKENAVLVTCLLNAEVKGCRKLVISWRKDAEEHWNKFLASTFQIKKISNLSDIWKDCMDIVESMIKGKDIMLVKEKCEHYIQLVGFYEEVKTTHGEVMGEKEKLERIRRIGKETMPLKSAAKKRLLDRDGIFQRLGAQFSDFDVFFEQSSEEIVLSGVPEDRNIAKLQIYEELRKFDEPVVIHDSTVHFSDFIKEGAPRNYIFKEMETNGFIVDWDVSTENGNVFVYCIPADSAQHVATQMKKMVKETCIPLSEPEQLFVTTEEWTMYQAEAASKCDGLVHIVVTNDLKNVIWISMEGIHAEILEDLKDFIKKNTIVEEMIQCNPITKKFMQAFWETKDYNKIEENSGDKHLHLTWQGDRLKVKGTVEGIQKAKDLWKEKTSGIIHKSHTLKRVGIKEVLMSVEQTGLLKALEKEHRCLIQPENSDLPSHEEISRHVKMDEGERTYDTRNESMILEIPRSGPYRCQNGLTISLTKGQLAQQKVDVIVCATSPDLNLNSGAASKSLLQRGGQGLQDDCRTKYAEKIQEGEVVDIYAGDLQCDKVYLTVLPDWRRSNNGESLRDVVIQCLVKAHDDSKRSIAFAAMGTGQLHYPHHDVARLMYDACIVYDRKNPQSSVKIVHFVLYEKDNDSIRAFEKEEKDMLCGGARPRSSAPAPQERLVGNLKISQTVEELANQQVDAILCSCAENLVLSQSGACAALLRVGGQSLQDECKMNYPNGIMHGQIATIGGGNLKCKHVFLTSLPQYVENGEKVLFDVITAALQLAATKGCKSIAMPAMGSGFLQYPAELVAKVMYDAVGDWAKKNTTTSLTAVKFVLFFKDKSTQDAFQDQLRGTLPRTNIRKQRTISIHDVKTLPGNGSCIIIDPSDDSACTVGKMKVKVCTGDILNETTDAIVNSVGADFSFQVETLRQSGVVMTDSFGLKCKKILHVKFQDNLMGWKRVMKKCLEKASKHKLSSIAFPVLGTGSGHTSFAADKIAEMFFEALIDFDDGKKDNQLQQVNVVVYHKQPQFIPAIKKGMVKISRKGPRGAFGRTWDRIKDVGREMKEMVLPRSGLAEHRRTPAFSRSQMSKVTIQVYSDSELNINHCITNLEKKLDMAYISTPLTDDLIAKMSPQEFEEFFKTDLLVECEFIKEEKQVLIRGTQQNVSRAQNEFQGKLRDKARKESEKEEAEQLYQIVQWHYEEVTQEEMKLTPYEKLINLRMEKAFKNDETYLELPDPSNNQVYIVDFKNYVEYVKGDEQDSVKIVRKDILKAKLGALPETWDEMQDKENLKRIGLLNPSPEYQQLESIFLTEAKTGTYSNRVTNVQNIKVVKIERIQNKTLYQQYSAKKKLMETRYKDKPTVTIERKVWHGTPYDSVDSICTHGFNRSYCGKNGVWFGHGVYFATNASYSARAWLAAGKQAPPPGTKQYIFYVSVCVGEYIKGDDKMRVLPPKNKSNPTDVYDCAVNDVNNVEEIVIFNDTQAYPDYLITFTS